MSLKPLIKEVVRNLKEIRNPLELSMYIQELDKMLEWSEEELKEEINES